MPFDRDRPRPKTHIDVGPITPSWPPKLAHYEYVRTLSKADCAWEFLRRNRHYHADYRACLAISTVTQAVENGVLIIRQNRNCPAAEGWGCLTFADPALPAPCPQLFWHHETGAPSLACIASESVDVVLTLTGFAERGVALSLLTIGDKQYLRVSRGQATLTLTITGASIFSNVRLSFQVPGCAHIGPGIEALRLFQEFLIAAPGEMASERPWTARWLALRDALIALDGAQAGATYRDIAGILVGDARAAVDWRANTALKDRVRRALARGKEMRDGGYRALLSGEWR
ncbi:MAG: DUF2285 domain-containing protein [Hyphomicrobiales bacterium]|nr:DUF2285 domain-containing protein [Hyphomicrobiales bacterium]